MPEFNVDLHWVSDDIAVGYAPAHSAVLADAIHFNENGRPFNQRSIKVIIEG